MDLQLLGELLNYQAWADAELRAGLASLPEASADRVIMEKLNHIYLTQKAFLMIVRKEPIDHSMFAMENDIRKLTERVRIVQKEYGVFMKECTDALLSEEIIIPWLKDPPARFTTLTAMLQAIMHSQYHRGQVATRIRELGGKPPLTDLIYWYWKGKPEADWTKT